MKISYVGMSLLPKLAKGAWSTLWNRTYANEVVVITTRNMASDKPGFQLFCYFLLSVGTAGNSLHFLNASVFSSAKSG